MGAFEAGPPVDAEAGGIAADSLAPKRVGELMFMHSLGKLALCCSASADGIVSKPVKSPFFERRITDLSCATSRNP